MCPQICDDLVPLICSYIHSEGVFPLFTKKEVLIAYSNLSVLSRTWWTSTRKIQFETTHASTSSQFCGLFRLLREGSTVVVCIRNLVIGHNMGIITKFRRLEEEHIDTHVLCALIPSLRGLTVQNIPRVWHLYPRDAADLRIPIVRSHTSRLTELTVNVGAFGTYGELYDAIRTHQFLTSLCFCDVNDLFVRKLLYHLPPTIQRLKLEEQPFFQTMEAIISNTEPLVDEDETAAVLPLIILQFRKFAFHGLTPITAGVLEATLLKLALNAGHVEVFVDIPPPKYTTKTPDGYHPLVIDDMFFDFERFRDRLRNVAVRVDVYGYRVIY